MIVTRRIGGFFSPILSIPGLTFFDRGKVFEATKPHPSFLGNQVGLELSDASEDDHGVKRRYVYF